MSAIVHVPCTPVLQYIISVDLPMQQSSGRWGQATTEPVYKHKEYDQHTISAEPSSRDKHHASVPQVRPSSNAQACLATTGVQPAAL
jgi:hypothetical protein